MNSKESSSTYPAICLLSENDYHFVFPSEIIYIQSDGNNSKLMLTDKRIFDVKKNLSEVERRLPEEKFVRIHNSTIVNLIHIKKYFREDIQEIELSDGSRHPLARRRKSDFLKKFVKI